MSNTFTNTVSNVISTYPTFASLPANAQQGALATLQNGLVYTYTGTTWSQTGGSGVASLNTLTGAVSLVQGPGMGVTITPSGSTIQLDTSNVIQSNLLFEPNATYDIGSPDGGTTIEAPNNIFTTNLIATGSIQGPISSSTIVSTAGSEPYHLEANENVITQGGSGSTTINWSQFSAQSMVLTRSATFVFNFPTTGGAYILRLTQGGTGSYTATWPASIKWPNATPPTLSTTVGKQDLINFYYNGTNFLGSFTLGY